jgi:flagellar assembly protein FliH
MITHSLKLVNRVIGIQHPGMNGELNCSDNTDQANLSLSTEHVPKGIINEKNKTISVLKSQIEVLENELQKTREESYLAGFNEGRNIERGELKKQIKDIVEEFAVMIRSMKDQYDRSLENMNEPLLELSMKIAEKIIGKELQFTHNSDQVLVDQIKRMLNKVTDQNQVTIRVNPKFIDCVNKDHILNELNSSLKNGVNFISDERLFAGECILETEDFILDGLLSRQISNVRDKMLGTDTEWTD